MIRAAIIDSATSRIETIVEYEELPANPPPGFGESCIAVANEFVGPDWEWDGRKLVAPLVVMGVAPVPSAISDRQFFQRLAEQGVITQAEALSAVKVGAIPATLQALINQMPQDQQFAALMIVSGGTTFERMHPMTIAIGTAYGWSSDEIDAFFTAAAVL